MGGVISEAILAIRARLLRSALVSMTVCLGISAVLATSALTNGLQADVTRDVAKAGRLVSVIHQDIFYIAEVLSGRRAPDLRPELKWRDLDVLIRDLGQTGSGRAVQFIPAEVRHVVAVPEAGVERKTVLVATTARYLDTIGYTVQVGRFINDRDVAEQRRVCVLDMGTARGLFGPAEPETYLDRVLPMIDGERHEYEIVGVLEEPFALREKFGAFDTVRHGRPAIFARLNLMNAYVPIGVSSRQIPAGVETVEIDGVRLEADAAVSALLMNFGDAPTEEIGAYESLVHDWAESRKVALFILPQWVWLQIVGDLVGEADIIGGLIWIVILAVTTIMILVINLVVVRERFREIAIRRTEGARRVHVVGQLALESAVLSLAGGAMGIVGGFVAAHLLSTHVTGWAPAFEAGQIALAIAAALAVGALATAAPAFIAARLDPVKVLSKR